MSAHLDGLIASSRQLDGAWDVERAERVRAGGGDHIVGPHGAEVERHGAVERELGIEDLDAVAERGALLRPDHN